MTRLLHRARKAASGAAILLLYPAQPRTKALLPSSSSSSSSGGGGGGGGGSGSGSGSGSSSGSGSGGGGGGGAAPACERMSSMKACPSASVGQEILR